MSPREKRRWRLPFTRRSSAQGTLEGVTTADTAASPSAPETPADDPAVRARVEAALAPLAERELVVALDVDGTLVHHDGTMTPRVHDALQKVADTHHVVIATGRSVGATLPIVRAAGVRRGHAVCSNGAVLLEIDPGETDGFRVAEVRSFRPGEALRTLREAAPRASYAVEMPDGTFYSTGDFQDNSFGVRATPMAFEDLAQLDAVRVVVHDPDLSPQEFSRIVSEAGVHGVEYAIGWTAWLDMAAPGVSKATGLQSVCERLGIPESDSVAVGDGFNDTEMLRWAGVGVAMGQAPEGVGEAADVRTAGVVEDGAGLVLETLLP
ncbi:HAD family hydrolase [Brachybacterium sp. AOP25-B2-12]|uniref:HAD family hydrolase n=1 Tax=Brachybacterium sp. AOP25-B2-12 TaxID=3457710 RepID=UPI004033AE77